MEWKHDDEYIMGEYKNYINDKTKLYGLFDLDGTIIKTKSKSKFYKDLDDWEFFNDNVINKLRELNKTHNIIIITNQGGIEKKKIDKVEWKNRIENMCEQLDVALSIYCSKGNDIYRKPHPTFYKIIRQTNNIRELAGDSFYCGDAMGRKNDHSDTDLKFALNCNLSAKTPEEIFTNNKIFIKKEYKYPKIIFNNTIFDYEPQNKEMIIMTGFPGSGKSHISSLIASNPYINYIIVSRDILDTRERCIKRTIELCKENYSIIIDNTNPSKSDRLEYINIAKKYNYKCISIIVDTNMELSKHNNYYRRYIGQKDLIPDIAYNIYKKKYNEPTKNEGFEKVIKVIPPSPSDIEYLNFFY